MRYLYYDLNHDSPILTDTLEDAFLDNANDCLGVIVDLIEKKRYFNGEWKDVEIYPSENRSCT